MPGTPVQQGPCLLPLPQASPTPTTGHKNEADPSPTFKNRHTDGEDTAPGARTAAEGGGPRPARLRGGKPGGLRAC